VLACSAVWLAAWGAVCGINGVLIGKTRMGIAALDSSRGASINVFQHPELLAVSSSSSLVRSRIGPSCRCTYFCAQTDSDVPRSFASIGFKRLELLVRIHRRRLAAVAVWRLGPQAADLVRYCFAADGPAGQAWRTGNAIRKRTFKSKFLRGSSRCQAAYR